LCIGLVYIPAMLRKHGVDSDSDLPGNLFADGFCLFDTDVRVDCAAVVKIIMQALVAFLLVFDA